MKRVAVFLIVFGMVLLGNVVIASGNPITIGYAVFNVGVDSYETFHNKNFKAECDKLGVNLIQLDAQGDAAKQISQVETLMQRHPDVIVIWPVNGKAIVPVVKKAHDAGFKILIANSPIDDSGFNYITCFAGPDNTKEGSDAARMMISAFKGKSGQKQIVELMGLPGYVTAIQRSDGSRQVIKQQSGFNLVASVPTDWNREKATSAMEDLLVKYPNLQGVYAADDNIAVGAINALKEKGKTAGDVVITGACVFGEGYDAMKGLDPGDLLPVLRTGRNQHRRCRGEGRKRRKGSVQQHV